MSFKNIAIVGANGFIGKHLTETLMQNSELNIHLFGKSEISIFENILPYTKIDLRNAYEINQYFSNIDLIYYLASESIPASTWENPISEIEKNLMPFVHFLECVAKHKVKKIVFISSAGTIYGPSDQKLNENSNKKPFSPHGIIKLTMEYFLNYYELKYNLKFDIYRVSNVYGESQNTSKGLGIINTFIEKIVSEKRIKIFGNGKNVRNYIYIKDVVRLLSLSARANDQKSNIYNLSSNDTLSINELVSIIKKIIPENFEVIYENQRQSDNPAIYLDNSKILKDFPGFNFSSMEENILKTYLFIKKNIKQ
jgi:UDP-glucose 4-epimerase